MRMINRRRRSKKKMLSFLKQVWMKALMQRGTRMAQIQNENRPPNSGRLRLRGTRLEDSRGMPTKTVSNSEKHSAILISSFDI
jgi:hypothetical protein